MVNFFSFFSTISKTGGENGASYPRRRRRGYGGGAPADIDLLMRLGMMCFQLIFTAEVEDQMKLTCYFSSNHLTMEI
jgi:hypothetical protein